jgi:hypothetical protein
MWISHHMINYCGVLLYILLGLFSLFVNIKAELGQSTNDIITLKEQQVCSKPRIVHKFSKKKVTTRESPRIARNFTRKYSLSLVIGNCEFFPHWVEDLYCTENLRVYIYLKCRAKTRLLNKGFTQSCIQQIPLRSPKYIGMSGTIKYHLYTNYNNLTDYTIFMKDNNRKSLGLSMMQRLGCALTNMELHAGRIRFMTISDVPPAYHSLLRVHNTKSRSVRSSYPHPEEISSAILRQNVSSRVSKYCAVFERLTCTRCRKVWIPVRSQFMVSADLVRQVQRKEFSTDNSMHYEYTWALLFNCFSKTLSPKRKGRYPYFACT